jgi:hypothetical protein
MGIIEMDAPRVRAALAAEYHLPARPRGGYTRSC